MKMAENIDLSTIEGLEIAPTDTTEEKPAEEEATPVDQEAIDASANIINNFAKVFAEKRQEQLQTEPNTTDTAEKVSAQLENLNISQQIENAIVEQVKSGIEANFDRLATDIIAKQTREWLNENLVSIVEKTVAKEIERVIAKVGS